MRSTMLYIALFIVFTNLSCSSRLNKLYEYEPALYTFKNGEVGAKLLGTFNAQKGLTIKGSPYELLVWYETALQVKGSVAVISIELSDLTTGTVLKKNESLKTNLEPSDDNKYVAYFSISGIDLEYLQYALDLKLIVKADHTIVSKTVKLELKKAYKEFRSNDFWDRISSI